MLSAIPVEAWRTICGIAKASLRKSQMIVCPQDRMKACQLRRQTPLVQILIQFHSAACRYNSI